ncbi:MAG: sigma-70 family RNA polymerase sigma factor [Faecalibacterium sp.]|jgi:RNA polymerase sigma factor (sigma-70 family)|nr:sigma-70 family RNA polymerase sigma factor [Faecalibacterium sp.]
MAGKENLEEWQEVNAALVLLAKTGSKCAVDQLYFMNEPFISRFVWEWFTRNSKLAIKSGLTPEDLKQYGYAAVLDTIPGYTVERGKYIGYLTFALQTEITRAVTGAHGKNVLCADGKNRRFSANPLNNSSSLDAPVSAEDDGGTTVGDMLPDNSAQRAFESIEESDRQKHLRDALKEALSRLSETEEAIIRQRYYAGRTYPEIAAALDIPLNEVQKYAKQSLRALRRDWRLRKIALENDERT